MAMTTDGAGKRLLDDGGSQIETEVSIKRTRDLLKQNGEMALGHLIYAAMDHASAMISHPDHALRAGIELYNSKTKKQWIDEARSVVTKVWQWAEKNPIKVSLMVIGLGISAFKAKVMGQDMLDAAASFCAWCRRKPLYIRFWGFVALMSVRLIVSTLVPPTSPGFGIIIQAATPDEQKWTAMPCFLLASAFAGAWPYILDKFLEVFMKEDFCFTMLAKYFADNYPLTCWTGPAMREAFHHVYQSGGDAAQVKNQKKYGKLGASFAVIVGHVVPFMGAQTTIMQRFFLPHPLDTIISQPFGMTEDLVSMAMAEAISSPVLASASLTALIVFFNLARGLIFTGHTAVHADEQDRNAKDAARTPIPYIALASRVDNERSLPRDRTQESITSEEATDYIALLSACLNILVGMVTGFVVSGSLSIRAAFFLVVFQMMVQLLAVPVLLGHSGIFDQANPP